MDIMDAKGVEDAIKLMPQDAKQLCFGGTEISLDGAKKLADMLAKNESLRELDLGDMNLGDNGVKHLAKALATNSSLQTLWLGSNKIGPDGAKALADALEENKSLLMLWLTYNNVGAEGAKALAKALAKNSSLQTLELRHNNIDDDGAKALADALTKNKTLQKLELWKNNIGDDGAKALADALEDNKSLLNYLDLSGNRIGDAGAEALATALESNSSLQKLGLKSVHSSRISPGILARIATQVKLVQEELRDSSKFAYKALLADAKVRWGRVKLMIVGKGAAGKTSTIRSLLGQPYNPDHDSTIGVDLKLMRTRDWEERNHVSNADLGEQFAKCKYRLQDVAEYSHLHLSDDVVQTPRPPGNVSTSSSASNQSFDQKDIAKAVTSTHHYAKEKASNLDDEISFMIWDYGGQEVFYALHHLFLTQYGVYMLVFDMREVLGKERFKEKLDEKEYAKLASQEDSLETLRFWIDSIRLHAPDANIAIVGTYLDQVPDSEDHEEIEDSLETEVLRPCGAKPVVLLNAEARLWFFPIDNTDRDDKRNQIMSLRESLSKAVADKDFVKKKVPLRWSYCLEKLLAQDEDYLSLRVVKELATKECRVPEVDVPEMLKYMHELGVLVHLTTGQHDVLRQTVVIRPQWLLKNLTRVICDPSMNHMKRHKKKLLYQEELPRDLRVALDAWSERGVASRQLLEWLWRGQRVDYLVELMHAMLLACPSPWIDDIDEKGDIVDKEGALLIPSLLQPVKDDVRTEALCDLGEQHALAYIEFKVLPKGVFQRFVASLIQRLPGLVGVRKDVVFSNFASIAFDSVNMILETSGRRIMLHFETPANKSLKSHVEILQKCLKSIDSSFMRKNLGPKLFLSSDGSDSKESCASIDAFMDASTREVSSLQRGKRLPLERFSPFVENGEAARGLHSSVTSDAKPFDVFLSHDWGDNKVVHNKVKAVATALEKRGIRCWLDENDIGTEILDSMADGIDRSKAFVVFVTREYMRKVNEPRTKLDNCRSEFCYAVQQVKPSNMIPCVLEKEMKDMTTWKGRFGISWSGDALYVEMLNGGEPDEVKSLVWSISKVTGLQEDATKPSEAAETKEGDAKKAEKRSAAVEMSGTSSDASSRSGDKNESNVKSAEKEIDNDEDEKRTGRRGKRRRID